MKEPYQIADAAAAKIITSINRQFRHNRLAFFDEMNVLQTRKHVQKLYGNVEKIIKKELGNILAPLEEMYYDIALDMGFDGDPEELDESFIEEFFEEYNPVTKYVFKNELSRKQSRLFESLVADTLERNQNYKTAEKLLVRQIKQSTIDLEDEVAKSVYKAVGVKKVQWVAEHDERTCGICHELDGTIYDLKDIPPKQHYQCRCYLIPVRVEK